MFCTGRFPKVMVDAENCSFVEMPQKDLIEMSRRFQVVTEWLLDDNPSVFGAVALCQVFHDSLEHRGRNRQVVCWPLRSFQFLAKSLKSGRILIVSINIAEKTG
jgi:hypothetical protein